jgi:hypothetical protein
MKKYVVEGRMAEFFAGAVLMLSEDQSRSRIHALKPLKKKGFYEVTAPVQFKRGEEIGFEGEVNKTLLQEIVPAHPAPVLADPAAGVPGPGPEQKKPGVFSGVFGAGKEPGQE